jgi:outer membrane protein assembly factor BamB
LIQKELAVGIVLLLLGSSLVTIMVHAEQQDLRTRSPYDCYHRSDTNPSPVPVSVEDKVYDTPVTRGTSPTSDAGLMNSSWPMFRHDVRHTGRSSYGPVGNWPLIKWKFWMEGRADSSPAIDENGTIYIGAETFDKSFFAIYPNGIEKWRFSAGDWVDSSPALSANGIIYFGTNNGNLDALYQNGTTKWSTHLGTGWVYSSPAIDNNETILLRPWVVAGCVLSPQMG